MDSLEQNPVEETGKKSFGNKKMLIIIISIILLGGLSAGGWYFFGKKKGTIVTADGKKVTYTTDNKNTTLEDEDGSLALGEDIKLPNDFPKNLPVYAGIKYTSAWSGKKNSDPNDTTTTIKAGYTGITKDSCSNAIAWFKSEFTKLGWKIDLETKSGLTVSTATEVAGNTATEANGGCDVSVSVMDKTEMPVTTSTGENNYDQVIEETRQMQEQVQADLDALENQPAPEVVPTDEYPTE